MKHMLGNKAEAYLPRSHWKKSYGGEWTIYEHKVYACLMFPSSKQGHHICFERHIVCSKSEQKACTYKNSDSKYYIIVLQ